jgi:hypothetical protein
VKFNECVIIQGKMMNRNKAFLCERDMQDIIKNKITARIGNTSFTNASYVHTYSISSMNLVSASITIMHSEAV